ncbi:alkaline phosphatase family protein [Streptomyces sp. NPDC059718]
MTITILIHNVPCMILPRSTSALRITLALLAGATGVVVGAPSADASALPRPDHVVVVMMENKGYDDIIGRPDEAPYLNDLASRSASFTNYHGITHPSQPNYLALFSGSTQGVTSDDCPVSSGASNLGRELLDSGLSFSGYSEDMPREGYTGCNAGTLDIIFHKYERKHNPWVNFSNLPSSANKTFTQFPSDYSRLPTVSFVVPNMCNDMHYCSRDTGDAWVQHNLSGYEQWARTHNSLLVVTWDEDDGSTNNQIPTIIAGANVIPGQYGTRYDHYSLLRTIEDFYGLPRVGASATATQIAAFQGNSCTQIQLLGNAGFETGTAAPWSASTGVISNSSNEPAHAGSWKAWLDGYGTTHTDTISQSVTIPPGCNATLSFWQHIDTRETGSTLFDTLTVQIGSTNLATYSNADSNVGYAQRTFNVSSFAGQTVTINFTGTEDFSNLTNFVLDDVALNIS